MKLSKAEIPVKKEALKKKLHDKVNPVDNHEVFEARKQKELQEIDQLRKEVALLMADIGSLQKEAEVTLMTQIADPGEEGSRAHGSRDRRHVDW